MSIRYTAEQLQRKFPGPAGSPGYARVADALRNEGRLDEAVELCREGLRARPLVAGYVVLGKALMDAGRWEEAREQLEAALRIDPRCLSAMRSLALIMDKLQWSDAAAGYYRSILEVEPWDAEIRALLEGSASGPGSAAQPGSASASGFAPMEAEAAAVPDEEEGFIKPEGLSGDVLEVNLNDIADDFLPSDGERSDPISLEDGFASATSQFPAGDYSPAADSAVEPKPMESLSPSSGPETLGENAPAPISGADVEERLDSLFGSEYGGSPSATATWTAAAPSPDAPPEASATSTGELRSPESVSDFPGEAVPFDLAAIPDVSDAPASDPEAMGNVFSEGPATTETGDASLGDDDRVHGEDIERRLDELFHLSGEDDTPKAPAASASDLPLAPAPNLGETVILGEPVAFGDRPALGEPRSGAQPDEMVTGQDVADQLDSMLGPDPQAKAQAASSEAAAAAEAATVPEATAISPEPTAGASAPAAGPFADLLEPLRDAPASEFPARAPDPFDGEALMSTESMLPSAWQADAPQVTGADVEAQLDKLFNLGPEPEPPAAESPLSREEPKVNLDETVTFVEPPAQAPAGDKADLKESVADWLARREDLPAPGPGDTLILPNETAFSDPETPAAAKSEDAFGTLAPEDLPGLSETASIEVVDGGDVAERLDQLFADVPEPEAPPLEPEPPALSDPLPEPEATMEAPIFTLDEAEPQPAGEEAFSSFPAGNPSRNPEIEKAAADAHVPETVSNAAAADSPELAPMLDEEEGYPADEEMPTQDAGANVATVTLAEIYFQQGLKEQALQIYRQLFEREPENESVRKRIAEIEASQAEGDRGPGADPRWPRPGLKVPKRKK